MDHDILKLWEKYRDSQDQSIRDKLILHYIHLIKYVAGRIAINLPSHIDFDDLVSYGTFGLLDAINKFDINKSVKFESYAITRIKGSIIDGLRKNDWIPRSVREKTKKFEKELKNLENKLGRSATHEEICQHLSLTSEELDNILVDLNSSQLLYFEDMQEGDKNFLGVEDSLDEIIIKKELKNSLNCLNSQEKLVISLFYFDGFSKKEISEILEVSQSRVSQIFSRAMHRLKNSIKI